MSQSQSFGAGGDNAIQLAKTLEAYEAAMVLSGVGDAMGYKNGEWEFMYNVKMLHAIVDSMGFEKMVIKDPEFILSDDTIMHMATARALIAKSSSEDPAELYREMAAEYKECMKDMVGRGPGNGTMQAVPYLRPNIKTGYKVPFNPRSGGCGAAMRSMCIGMVFWQTHIQDKLIAAAVESGRCTHTIPAGFLGSVASAFFTALAIRGVPLAKWGFLLLKEAVPQALEFVKKDGRDVKECMETWNYFEEKWAKFLTDRCLLTGEGPAKFPADFNPLVRHEYYKKEFSYSGWAGASGHDAPLIAYDSLLGCNGNWKEFCYRCVLHGGDNDSTGAIGACWFGLLNGGYNGVPKSHYEKLEYNSKLKELAKKLHQIGQPS